MPMATTVIRAELTLLRVCQGAYGSLLCWLLGLIVLAPGLSGGRNKGFVLDLLNCIVLLNGIRAASPRRQSLVVCAIFLVADLTSHWTAIFIPDRASFALHYGLTLVILAYTTRTILVAILRNSQVTLETLKASVCVYLLLGLLWVYIYLLIDLALPGSFLIRLEREEVHFGHLVVSEAFSTLLYFSYCTLTTLGYGDILPLTGPARTFSFLQAIVGQVYLTVLIARLVGMHITQSSAEAQVRLRVEAITTEDPSVQT
jgi:voltage-gated potassium channel